MLVMVLLQPAQPERRTHMARIEVLLRERAGYVARGLADRVAQVDAVLASMGYHSASSGRRSGSAETAETVVQPVIETAALEAVEDAAASRPGRRGGQRRVERG